jgi:hypothetical protein
MFSKHVSSFTSAYHHDELPPEQSRRVAEHLIGCLRCRTEYEEVRFGARLAEQTPLITAPDSLWLEIETALDPNGPNGGSTAVNSGRRIIPLLLQPRFALASLVLVGLGVAVVALWPHRAPGPAGAPGPASASWDVKRLAGAPRIGSALISDNGKLGVGEWIETDTNSRARINVGDIGQVEIDPNSRVRLLETKSTEHRLELAQGRLSARISAPPKLFFVNTPSGVAEDLGCAYTLEVDDGGNSLLRVTTGWVALELKDRESMVPAGAACQTRRGIGPGTPYFEDASDNLRLALAEFDFQQGQPEALKNIALEKVISEARTRDTLTLWHLLPQVEGSDRARVYERMAALVPPPRHVTRAGVLALNQEMLEAWKDTLESSWSNYSSPVTKSLK